MGLTSFSCPHCKKSLKSPQPVPIGKKVKCPGCTKVFEVEQTLATAVQAKSAPRPPAAAGPQEKVRAKKTILRGPMDDEDEDDLPRGKGRAQQDEADDAPRPKKRRRPDKDEDDDLDDRPARGRRDRDEDEEEDDDRPRRQRKRGKASRDDDEYDDDDDDRPRKKKSRSSDDEDDFEDDEFEDEDFDDAPRRKKKSKKKKKQKSNAGLFIGLGVVAVLLLLGTGAGIWLLMGSAPSVGSADPLAYMPAKADYVAGINMTALKSDPNIWQAINQTPAFRRGDPATALLKDRTDRFVVAGSADQFNTTYIMVCVANAGHDQKAILDSFNLQGPARRVNGHALYRNPAGEWLAFPNPKLLVVGKTGEQDFLEALEGKSSLPAKLGTLARKSSNKTIWGGMLINAKMRQSLKAAVNGRGGFGPGMGMFPGGPGGPGGGNAAGPVKDVLEAVEKAEGGSFSMDLNNNKAHIELGVLCAAPADAEKLEKGAKSFWETQGKGMIGMMGMMLPMNPANKDASKALNELASSVAFRREGNDLFVTANVSTNLANPGNANNNPGNPGMPNIPNLPKVPGKLPRR